MRIEMKVDSILSITSCFLPKKRLEVIKMNMATAQCHTSNRRVSGVWHQRTFGISKF